MPRQCPYSIILCFFIEVLSKKLQQTFSKNRWPNYFFMKDSFILIRHCIGIYTLLHKGSIAGEKGDVLMQEWHRRLAGLVVAAVGATFIVVVIVARLFSVGPAFERMSDGFRPIMKPVPITTLQRDLKGLQAVSNEFQKKGVPMFSQSLHMTPVQLNAFMQQQFPTVATGCRRCRKQWTASPTW